MSGAGELAMFPAVARRIAGGPEPDHAHLETEEMRALVSAEVSDLRNQLAEVEERLDFAERLLAHGGPKNQLPGGAHR